MLLEFTLAAQIALSAFQSPECMVVRVPVTAGDGIAEADVGPAPCTAARRGFRYDLGTKVARAIEDLQPGDVVLAIPPSAFLQTRQGESLYLQAAVGAVVVERKVEAVRASRPGDRIFVKGSDGEVFSVSPQSPRQ